MAAGIKAPKAKTDGENIDPFSPEERDSIIRALKALNSDYAALVEFMFRTGCRPSEAIGLQWRHISTDFKSITFEQSVTVSENGLVVKQGLKTQQKRVFPCGKDLTTFLKSRAPEQIDREQFIFKSPTGKLIDFDNFSNRSWHPTLKRMDIKQRKPYQMRHTFITHCINSGMNAKDVAILVGNSTEVIYKHYMGKTKGLTAPDF